MGVNSNAIDKINRQIRMLENYPSDDDYETLTETVMNEDTVEFLDYDTTVKIDTIDSISEINDESFIEEDNDVESTSKMDVKDNSIDKSDNNVEDDNDTSLDSTSIFLIYYIGIIFLVIFAIIILYFIFK